MSATNSRHFRPHETSRLKTRDLNRSVNRNPPENRSHPSVVARKLGWNRGKFGFWEFLGRSSL